MQQFNVTQKQNECTIEVQGAINENSDFSVIDLKSAKMVYLDLKSVTTLNSMGLRNWVNWVKQLKITQMIVRHCPRAVVDQMNILHGFLPMGAIVESFFVPYSCQNCGLEENYLALRGRDFQEGNVDTKEGHNLPQVKTCPKCQGQMEMDVVSSRYFIFLKYRRF